MHIISLPTSSGNADYKSVAATPAQAGGELPQKRVGHTAAVIGERIFMLGGRGGNDMKPLQEKGRVWIYNTRSDKWSFLNPIEDTPFPDARSDHSSVALDRPEARADQG